MRRPYKHAAAVADLRARILDGTYQPGDELPSIAQIRATYGLGDRAARAAIRELVEQGLAVTRIGHGTYVREDATPQSVPAGRPAAPPARPTPAPPPLPPPRARRTHAARRLAPTDAPTAGDEDLTPTTNTTTESPPPDVALMLDIDPAETVTTERTILSDPAGPVALRTTYRPQTTDTRQLRTITTHTSARRPTPSEASTLATTTAAIVLIQDETHLDPHGHPIAVVRTVHRADTTRLADTYHPHT